jgi:hypothetical protein
VAIGQSDLKNDQKGPQTITKTTKTIDQFKSIINQLRLKPVD